MKLGRGGRRTSPAGFPPRTAIFRSWGTDEGVRVFPNNSRANRTGQLASDLSGRGCVRVTETPAVKLREPIFFICIA